MFGKHYYLILLLLAACLVQNASGLPIPEPGSVWTWTGDGHDTMWNNPANWDWGMVPQSDAGGVVLAPTTNGSVSTIAATDVFNINGSISGPESGMTLNVYGTLNYGFMMVPAQWDASGPRSIVNVYCNGCINGDTFLLGDTWWWVSQPYITMNLYCNAINECEYMSFGAWLNIYDQATNLITGSVDMGPPNDGFWGQAGAVDANRRINVAGGYFICPTGDEQNITNWIGRGIFYVYGKQYDTNEVIVTDDGTYTYVTVPPLGGAMSSLSVSVPRSTMMAGEIQTAVAVANFPGVQNVPLNGIDDAQRGPGTIAYQSSDPTVISVAPATGLVTAINAGTATVSASFGSVPTSSGAVITVAPFTNSLIHRYSFSETSGSTTADSVGGSAWDGTLYGGATLDGGQVTLDGIDGYVQLPSGIVCNLDAVTIEAWANFGSAASAAAYAPLFAFGNQDSDAVPKGENYIAFQPFTGAVPPTANALFGAGDPGYADEEDATLPLVSGGVTNYLAGYMHIVCVYHPYAGYVALYTNGVLAAINSNVSNPLAATLGADPLNYLGASLYFADPFFAGSIDEFRIYNGPLTAGQILADYALGPNQLIGTSRNTTLLAQMNGDPSLVLSWPTNSVLVSVYSSAALGPGASWSPVIAPMTVVGTNYQMTVPATSTAQFFRLQQY